MNAAPSIFASCRHRWPADSLKPIALSFQPTVARIIMPPRRCAARRAARAIDRPAASGDDLSRVKGALASTAPKRWDTFKNKHWSSMGRKTVVGQCKLLIHLVRVSPSTGTNVRRT